MSYAIDYSARFKKSLKKLNAADTQKTLAIVEQLASGKKLPAKNKDHKLTGDHKGMRECHIRPDLLLIYQIKNNNLVLYCFDVGSHSNLFKE